MRTGTLAIVAGRGALPRRVAEAAAAEGQPYLLIVFPECWEPWMADHPHQHHRFEKVGRLFDALSRAGADRVCFAGAMDRPRLKLWQADLAAVGVAARAIRLLGQGDDAMLRGFGAIFEGRGMRLVGAAELLGEEATLAEGALGRHAPDAAALADARRAAAIVAATGELDVGQGAVVAGGLCLAVEAIEGTDAMLARVAALPPEKRRASPPPSGVLFKGPKPGQDRRVDLPAIGPATVDGAARAGLSGIVGAAGGVLLPEPEATRRAADAAGIFVWGAGPEALP